MYRNYFYSFIFILAYLSHGQLYSMSKLPYQLPDEGNNWILNSKMQDSTVVVQHRKGVSVSNDSGKTFFEANLPEAVPEDLKWHDSFIFIEKLSSRIFLATNKNFYISMDSGKNFKHTGLPLRPFSGISSLITLDGNIYLSKKYSFGHERCDTNVIYVSENGGKDFREQEVGTNGCAQIYALYDNSDKIYAKSTNIKPVFVSSKKADNFENIVEADAGWQKIVTEKKLAKNYFSKHFSDLNFPNSMISSSKNNYYIEYNQKNFNSWVPLDGIIYSYTRSQQNYQIKANSAPRFGGALNEGGFYYLSFYEIWKS